MVIGLLNKSPVFGRGLGSLQRGETLLRLAGTLGERALQTLRRRVSRRELVRPQHFFLAKKLDFSMLKPMERRYCFFWRMLPETHCSGKNLWEDSRDIFHSSHHGRVCRSRVDHFNFVKYIIRSTWGWLYIYYIICMSYIIISPLFVKFVFLNNTLSMVGIWHHGAPPKKVCWIIISGQ